MDFRDRYEALYQEALALKTQGRALEAEAFETQAAQLLGELERQARQHPDSPQAASALLFLAERQWAVAGDDPDVQAKLLRALAIRESHFGKEGLEVFEPLAQLAELHFLAGRWGESEPLYRRALSILEGHRAVSGLAAGKCLGGLAQALSFLGRTAESDPYFESAIGVSEAAKEDKRVLYFLYIYRAEGLEKLGRQAEGEALRQKAAALLPRTNPGEQGFQV